MQQRLPQIPLYWKLVMLEKTSSADLAGVKKLDNIVRVSRVVYGRHCVVVVYLTSGINVCEYLSYLQENLRGQVRIDFKRAALNFRHPHS